MKKNTLGSTGLLVSQIGFGGASLGGDGGGYAFGFMSEDHALNLVRHAYDLGINLFDSAPVYGFRNSEIRIGKALKDKRDKVIFTSKSGVTWHDNKRINMTNDVKTTRAMLEQSLKDFDTDYIDLYMIHWPDSKIDIRHPMEVLAKAKLEGKIKHIGLCNTNHDDFIKASEISPIEFFQAEHNLFNHEFIKSFKEELTTRGFMGWGTFDKGILTGRVFKGRDYDKSDARKWAPWWKAQDLDKKLSQVNKLQSYLEDYEVTLLEFALHFNLSFKEVSTVLCGAKTIDDLETIILALEKEISPNILLEGSRAFF